MSHTIGSVTKRFSTISSCSTDSSESDIGIHQREAAEAKLYYLRDVLPPDEFDAAVEQEIALARKNATANPKENQLKLVSRALATKIAKILKK